MSQGSNLNKSKNAVFQSLAPPGFASGTPEGIMAAAASGDLPKSAVQNLMTANLQFSVAAKNAKCVTTATVHPACQKVENVN